MSYDLMLKKAIDLQNEGALNQALDIYLKLIEVTPHNADLWNLMGLVAQQKGDFIKARDCFLSAIKYSPKPFGLYYFNLSLCFKSLGDKKEALNYMVKASELIGNVKEVWNYLGVLQIESSELEKGIKSLSKALEIDNNYTEASANLYYYLKDVVALEKLAIENSSDFYANFLYALLTKDVEQKEIYLNKAINISPYRSDVLLEYADFLTKKGDLKKALMFYYKAFDLNENDIRAILGIADIYLLEGDLEKSEQFYLKSFNICRDIYGAYLNYGNLLFKQQRFSEALEAYREVVKLKSDDADVCYNIALILRMLEDYEEALGLMFNSYLKDKNNPLFQIGIFETLVELSQKNKELALKIAQNWQKLDEGNIFSKRIIASLLNASEDINDAEYAKRLFDVFADVYDETINNLDCKIVDEFKKINPNIKGKILDLGCGSGIVAQKLSNSEAEFIGVDISPNMIAKAKSKNVYSKLYVKDLVEFLGESDLGIYDKVLAFDVFCYFGALKEVLNKLKGCDIWFSVEENDIDVDKDYVLHSSGRYRHRLSYIYDLKEELKYDFIASYPILLRSENKNPVRGFLINLK